MKDLLAIAAQNTIVAGILAILVYGLTRVWRRPPVAHLLWLVVLAKLIGPPVLPVDVMGLFSHRVAIESARRRSGPGPRRRCLRRPGVVGLSRGSQGPRSRIPSGTSKTNPKRPPRPTDEAGTLASWHSLSTTCVDLVCRHGNAALTAIVLAWIVGLGLCGAIALRRIIRFDRMIRGTLAAPQRWQAMAAELAGKLGVRRVPDLRLIDGAGVPMVWWVGRRPIIALPAGLIERARRPADVDGAGARTGPSAPSRSLGPRGRAGDFRLYWWNPMVGWVRRQLHEAEDLCCDAWVEWAFPDRKKDYAEVLFKAATLVGPTRRRAPALASSFLNHGVLKGRIEAVLEGGRLARCRHGRRCSWRQQPSSCCRPSCRRSRRPTPILPPHHRPEARPPTRNPRHRCGERSRARSPSRERMSR